MGEGCLLWCTARRKTPQEGLPMSSMSCRTRGGGVGLHNGQWVNSCGDLLAHSADDGDDELPRSMMG